MVEKLTGSTLNGNAHHIAAQHSSGEDGWYIGQRCSQEVQHAVARIMETADADTLEATVFDGGIAIARMLDNTPAGGNCPGRQVEVLDYGLMSLVADSARDEQSRYAVDLDIAAAAAWLDGNS